MRRLRSSLPRSATATAAVAAACLGWRVIALAQPAARFVPPSATERVADGPRTATLRPGYGRKFSDEDTRPVVTISNPYMDPKRPLFAKVTAMQCAADGRVVAAGEAGFDASGRPLASGFWQVGPDGAVTPIAARSWSPGGGRSCGSAVFAESAVFPETFSVAADGRLLFAGLGGIQSLTADGTMRRIAGGPNACNSTPSTGLIDGAADAARFGRIGPTVEDTAGHIWLADQDGCALRRIAKTGEVTTVLGRDALCNEARLPEDQPLLQTMAWDATRNELVVGGARTVATPVHDLYTTIFRVTPAGEARRVLFAKKATRVSPAKHHLDGIRAMTVDAKGRVLLVSLLMMFERRGFDALQLMQVDEPNATVVPLSGTKIPAGTWLAEHPFDGPLALAYLQGTRDLCAARDGTLYVNDELLIRKVDTKGMVTTWAF